MTEKNQEGYYKRLIDEAVDEASKTYLSLKMEILKEFEQQKQGVTKNG